MSQETVIAAVKLLLTAASLPAPSTLAVLDAEELGPELPADQTTVLLRPARVKERRMATAYKRVEYQLETHVCAYYGDAPTSAGPFRALADSVAEAYRTAPRLNGTADVDGASQCLFFGEDNLEPEIQPWRIDAGNGLVFRDAVLRPQVVEVVLV